MNAHNITKDTELRHLPSTYQLQLTKILDVGDESVLSLMMGSILDSNSQLRFNSLDIDSLRDHSIRHNKSAILVLLDEWSTMMGKNRPKVKTLLDLLIRCELYQAADYIADLVHEPHPVRPATGPAARVDISLDENTEQLVDGLVYPFSSINLTKINRINYEKPEHTPNMNFVNEVSLNDGNNNHPTATVAEQQQQQQIMSDLIKFSKSISTQIPAVVVHGTQDTTNSNSMAIPMTVNSSNNIPVNETSSYIPALSGLMLNDDSESDNVPAFLLSSNDSGRLLDTPDFSGLMNAVRNSSEQQYSSSEEEQSHSMTQSSISESSVSRM